MGNTLEHKYVLNNEKIVTSKEELHYDKDQKAVFIPNNDVIQVYKNVLDFKEIIAMEEVIKSMVEKYGMESQVDVCIEEMSELQKALIKERRTRLYNREKQFATQSKENIKEELADVLFMLEYLKHIFGISEEELTIEVNNKVCRTKERYLTDEKY